MRALILSTALITLSGLTTAEAQGLRNTLARCAKVVSPTRESVIERIEMLTPVMPAETPAAPKGTPFLLFQVRNPDGSLWEVVCNGDTGDVVDVEREVSSTKDPLFQRLAKINEADARKAALDAQPGKILGVEYEIESDGTPTYEFDLQPASGKAGMLVEVNATTGQVSQVWARAYALPSE